MSVKRVRNQEIFKFYKTQPFILREMSFIASNDSLFSKEIPSVNLLQEIIDNYELELERQMQGLPFAKISEFIADAVGKDEAIGGMCTVKSELKLDLSVPDENGQSSPKDYFDVWNVVTEFNTMMTRAWKYFDKKSKNMDLMRKHFDAYAICRVGITLIKKYKQSDGCGEPQAAFVCVAALMRLDFMKLFSFCYSNEYFKKLLKFQSKVLVKGTEIIRDEVMALANKEADIEWRKKNCYLLHYEMAKVLHSKYAEIFKKRLLEEALRSYSKKIGVYKNEKQYKERVKQIENGKGQCKLTVEHLKRGIRPAAESNHKYHDTGKEHRNKEASEE